MAPPSAATCCHLRLMHLRLMHLLHGVAANAAKPAAWCDC